jgi:hypothetical protein
MDDEAIMIDGLAISVFDCWKSVYLFTFEPYTNSVLLKMILARFSSGDHRQTIRERAVEGAIPSRQKRF